MPSISALFLHRSGLEASRVYNIEVGSTIRLVALGGGLIVGIILTCG